MAIEKEAALIEIQSQLREKQSEIERLSQYSQ